MARPFPFPVDLWGAIAGENAVKMRCNTGREGENAMKTRHGISIEEEKIERQMKREATGHRRQDEHRTNKLGAAQKKSAKKRKLEEHDGRNCGAKLTK